MVEQSAGAAIEMMQESVGVLGLGALGVALIKRLSSLGFDVSGADPDARALQAYLATGGANAAGSPLHLARSAQIILLALGRDELQIGVLGPNGVAAGLKPGAVLVDMSDSGPDVGVSLGRRLESRGLAWVEAVAVSEKAALVAGEATLLVGGDPAHIARCDDLFRAIATKVVRVGRVGDAGLVASLAAGASLLAHAALCEALITARSSGINPDAALSAIEAARPEISSGFVREQILSRRFDAGRSLATATADVDRALRAAGKANVPALFLSTLRQALARAHRQENGRGDVTDLFGALEALSHMTLSDGRLEKDEVASGH